MLTTNKKALGFIFAFICLIFVRNLAFWSAEQTHIFGDTAIFGLYLSALAKNFDSLLSFSNNFLFWNQSYLGLGLPTLSIIDFGYLYPPNLFIAFISALFGNSLLVYPLLTVSVLLHLTFGGFFVYKILNIYWKLDEYSAIVGGLLWVYLGFNLEYATATSVLFSASYLPICFFLNLLYQEKKQTKLYVLFYCCLALSFLVGYPMVSLVILGMIITFNLLTLIKEVKFLPVLSLVGEHLKGFFLITLPIISPLYFSAIISFPQSTRGSVLSLEGFLSNAINFSDLLESVMPVNTLFTDNSGTNIVHLYISIVALVLLLQAKDKSKILTDKRNLWLLVLALIGTLLALGGVTPLAQILYLFIPVITFFRRIAIFSLIPTFVLCLIIPQFLNNAFSQKEISKGLFGGVKLLILVLMFAQAQKILGNSGDSVFNYKLLYQALAIVAVVGVTVISALIIHRYNSNLGKSLLILAMILEAGTVISGRIYLNAKVNPMHMFATNEFTDYLSKTVKLGERVDLQDTHFNYSTDYIGIEQTTGYVSLASEYGVKIVETFNASYTDFTAKNLRNILGVKYLVRKQPNENPDLKLLGGIAQNPQKPNFYTFDGNAHAFFPDPVGTGYYIYQNPTALPRLYLAKRVYSTMYKDKTVLQQIEKLENSNDVIVFQTDVQNDVVSDKGTVDITEYKRNYIKARVSSTEPTFLANSTGYYPGWKVKVDGKPQKLIQTNWFMMGTYLPQGEHTVEFSYTPNGIVLSLFYIVIAGSTWPLLFENKKKAKASKVEA